jgi:hypothetical protein
MKKPRIAARLFESGSPTWTRTRDLRINSTSHPENYGSKVEDSEVIFFWVPSRVVAAEPIPNLTTKNG